MRPDPESLAWRMATRPESSNPPGAGGPPSGSAAQALRITPAAMQSANRATKEFYLSVLQALDGVGERFVVGAFLGGIAPDALGLRVLAQRPQHLAEMGGDLRIGSPGEGAAQIAERILQVAHSVQHPAHAVDDERIVGSELERLFDQLARFRQALVAVCQGITERVVGVRMLRSYFDQLA